VALRREASSRKSEGARAPPDFGWRPLLAVLEKVDGRDEKCDLQQVDTHPEIRNHTSDQRKPRTATTADPSQATISMMRYLLRN
jgi:hypothetical protein